MKSTIPTLLGALMLFSLPLTSHATDTVIPFEEARNSFAVKLFEELGDSNKNAFYSPISVSTALALAYEGAKGETKDEIGTTLSFLHEDSQNRRSFQSLEKTFSEIGDEGDVRLSMANALWLDNDLEFQPLFLSTAKEFYSAEIARMNFRSEAEPSRVKINTWVEEKTEERIKDLLPSGSITPLTRLVITNAIYFKGDWEKQFNPEATHEREFTLPSGDRVDVPTMYQTNTVPFYEDETFSLVELPYKGERLSMVVILPKEGTGIAELEKTLSGMNWSISQARPKKVEIYLPKFKSETLYTLNRPLGSLGMKKAFGTTADFSGITEGERLFISLIVHKAFVEVNEEGTEAAAATGIVMRALSHSPTPVFRADRPFLYYIKERATGTMLFMGRMVDPRTSE